MFRSFYLDGFHIIIIIIIIVVSNKNRKNVILCFLTVGAEIRDTLTSLDESTGHGA